MQYGINERLCDSIFSHSAWHKSTDVFEKEEVKILEWAEKWLLKNLYEQLQFQYYY